DEPLSALDLKLRQAMRDELKTLQRETGITFIFVTHDQEEALTMSDQIAVISAGQLQQIGTPYDIYERPFNRFVADFIGDTNFIDARIAQLQEGKAIVEFAEGVTVEVEAEAGWQTGETATLAVRPEKITILPSDLPPESAGPGDSSIMLEGTVRQAVYLGTDTSYKIALGAHAVMDVRDQNAINGKARFEAGSQVRLVIPNAAFRLLED
ncbi:MAG: ABC transporter ATP-binding protein, partial [Pseudomonadota bacterium]